MMNKLSIKLANVGKRAPIISIDGKIQKIKKDELGNQFCEFETPNNSVNVSIKKFHELSGRNWLWMGILFLIVSVFGIFDKPYGKDFVEYDCNFNIALKDFTRFEGKFVGTSGVAMKFACDGEINVISNLAFIDPKIKKRRKILLALRIVMIIAFVLTVACVAITKIVNG